MADWSTMDREWPADGSDPFDFIMNNYYQECKDNQQPSGSQQNPSPMQNLTSPQQSFSSESFTRESFPQDTFESFPQDTFPQDTSLQESLQESFGEPFPQQMLFPELMNTQQIVPQSMVEHQMMSSQELNIMPQEQIMTPQPTQFEMMFPEELMVSDQMTEYQPMMANQSTTRERSIASPLLTQQLLSPERMMPQFQMPQPQMPQSQIPQMHEPQMLQPQMPQPQSMMPQLMPPAYPAPDYGASSYSKGDSPREIRNKAEKQRRDKLNHSISELASIVPPVAASRSKIDKTGILRLTAHYLRAYQYVFGDSIWQSPREFSAGSAQALLSLLNGFLLTTTYRGIVVVVSQNIQQYLGYSEINLLGQNIFNYVHPDDVQIMQRNLMPDVHLLGPSGELLLPEEMEGRRRIAAKLASEKRRFMVRFRKFGQRCESAVYVPCYVEGTLRKSDRASRTPSRCCQVVRRARARGETPYSSGNDVVFIGIVRPTAETFVSERHMEAFRMEYRTRHSVDGEIMECEQRISMVAGYMTHEVNGVNAMHFMHRDDVRWVIFTLREMYDQHLQIGESCYRLMAKNGQFLYMRTRGILDIDERSKAVRSMVCTNTVVDEKEGKHLIRLMKQKCLMMINGNKSPTNGVQIDNINLDDEDQGDQTVDQTLPEQDLEKVILTLVTNLPSPPPAQKDCKLYPPAKVISRLKEIDSSQKQRILSAVAHIYNLITTYRNMGDGKEDKKITENRLGVPVPATRPLSPGLQAQQQTDASNRRDAAMKRQFEGLLTDEVPCKLSAIMPSNDTQATNTGVNTYCTPATNQEFNHTQSTKVTVFGVNPDTVVTYVKENSATNQNEIGSLPTNFGASSSAQTIDEGALDIIDVELETGVKPDTVVTYVKENSATNQNEIGSLPTNFGASSLAQTIDEGALDIIDVELETGVKPDTVVTYAKENSATNQNEFGSLATNLGASSSAQTIDEGALDIIDVELETGVKPDTVVTYVKENSATNQNEIGSLPTNFGASSLAQTIDEGALDIIDVELETGVKPDTVVTYAKENSATNQNEFGSLATNLGASSSAQTIDEGALDIIDVELETGVKPDTVVTYVKENSATNQNEIGSLPTNFGASSSAQTIDEGALDIIDVELETGVKPDTVVTYVKENSATNQNEIGSLPTNFGASSLAQTIDEGALDIIDVELETGVKPDTVVTYVKENSATNQNEIGSLPTNFGASSSAQTIDEGALDIIDVELETGVKPDTVVTYAEENSATNENEFGSQATNLGASSSAQTIDEPFDKYIDDELGKYTTDFDDNVLFGSQPESADVSMELDFPADLDGGNDVEETADALTSPSSLPIIPEFEFEYLNAIIGALIPYETSSQDPNAADVDAAVNYPEVSNQDNAPGPSDGAGQSHGLIGPENVSQQYDNLHRPPTRRSGRKDEECN